ncbi:hypothetical protein CH370_09690 [Leptospira kmetyi]|uniref:hypothetical protein n=1 Tax=Leptospira kmetyi TaxID=408139 RepID=UPI000C2AD752|nr:hypothetical protein [Leptospira kmetyi]PJZ41701.1 hypothetical protein CH370_09690 [Leptospira kmetyi]
MKNLGIHFFYVTTILLVTIILLLTYRWASDSNLVSYVSFGATITSLFLGLIAIIYSIVSNNSLNSSLGELGSTSNSMTIAAKTIEEGTKQLFESIQQIPTMVGKVESRVEESHRLLEAMSSKDQSDESEIRSKGSKKSEASKEIKIEDSFVEQYMRLSSIYGLFSLYICSKSFMTKKAFRLNEILTPLSLDHLYYYFHAYIVSSSCSSLFEHSVNDGIFNVFQMHEYLLNNISEILKEKISAQQGKNGREYQKFIKLVDGHF